MAQHTAIRRGGTKAQRDVTPTATATQDGRPSVQERLEQVKAEREAQRAKLRGKYELLAQRFAAQTDMPGDEHELAAAMETLGITEQQLHEDVRILKLILDGDADLARTDPAELVEAQRIATEACEKARLEHRRLEGIRNTATHAVSTRAAAAGQLNAMKCKFRTLYPETR